MVPVAKISGAGSWPISYERNEFTTPESDITLYEQYAFPGVVVVVVLVIVVVVIAVVEVVIVVVVIVAVVVISVVVVAAVVVVEFIARTFL